MAYRIIVAHPGKQHSFKTALALKRNNMLYRYVTTVYDSKSSHLMKTLKRFLLNKDLERAVGRRTEELDDKDVIQFCEFSGLIEIILYRIDKKKRVYRWWHNLLADRFGKKVAELAISEHADAVIMCDTTAKKCFELLKEKAPNIIRIMDSSAANRLYMRQIYQNDSIVCPNFAKRIKRERGHLWNSRYCKMLGRELQATEIFLAPSNFVKKSLEFSGISPNQVFLCPYGTNFRPKLFEKTNNGRRCIQALYVGNVTEMKGIYYLLEAISHFQGRICLTLLGEFDNRDHLFDQYLGFCKFVGRVPHSSVQNYLKQADVFVFPSLGEGLSLAVLEAMSCGLPCIVSENSGANDAIIDGVNGFVIKPQSVEALDEKLMWCCENRDKLPSMGKEAYQTAMKYTWNEYEARLVSIVSNCLKEREIQCTD